MLVSFFGNAVVKLWRWKRCLIKNHWLSWFYIRVDQQDMVMIIQTHQFINIDIGNMVFYILSHFVSFCMQKKLRIFAKWLHTWHDSWIILVGSPCLHIPLSFPYSKAQKFNIINCVLMEAMITKWSHVQLVFCFYSELCLIHNCIKNRNSRWRMT